MAVSSSSSSTTLIQGKYDVFISFRGTDTRDNILSHLHALLCREKIETFIDNDLRKGDDVSVALLKTIAESKISVIMFSENYGSSRWCLDELVQIMECKKKNRQIVIPIFYKVDPSHVRNQSGRFGQALARFEGHPNIQNWRNALTKAGKLSGWDSRVIGPEATLIENIVGDILNKLYHVSSSDYDGLVGIRSRIQQIESMLNACSDDVRIIGIWGMGGIGKSTIAGAFFNQMLTQFEGHCFLANVREESKKRGLNILRQKLLAEILQDVNINVATPNMGLSFIRNRLRHKKVLVVLDDVDDSRQLEFLAGGHDWFGRGSVIIITCRDKQVLQNGVDCTYEIQRLDNNEALSLFSRYAFKEKHLADGYHWKLSIKAMTYAKGNPLALKILGFHLCGRTEQEQESALRKLMRTAHIDVQKVLLVSYDGLDHEEKKLFLNIACFFKGEYVDVVKCFHDACGCSTDIGIRVLIDKSLITVDKGQVWMHDLLQEMGRQIVREESIEEPGKRSRIWDHDEISHVLTDNAGTEVVKGILLYLFKTEHLNINAIAFESMPNLEYLKIRVRSSIGCLSQDLGFSPVNLPCGLKYLSNKLRYLYWERYPLTYLPSNFHPESLVMLDMRHSHVERLWNGRQNLVHLKEIDLSFSKNLIEIPDLSLATNLRALGFCPKLKNLSIRNNSNLNWFYLGCCFSIEKFPEVPLEIKNLYLYETGIKEIPSTIWNFKSLLVLDLDGCKMLKKFPEIPLEIKYLELNGTGIGEAPCNLKSLNILGLGGCRQLSFSETNVQKIPDAIKHLTNLKILRVENCRRLQSLPQLPMNVQYINAVNCISLEMVASPLFTARKGIYDSPHDHVVNYFNFRKCSKLDQIARNSIVADLECRLLHWRDTYPETFGQEGSSLLLYAGGDVPDWFKYKASGSLMIAKLPPHWCNDELLCLVFCIAVEYKDLSYWCNDELLCLVFCIAVEYQIRNNRGEGSIDFCRIRFGWRVEFAKKSTEVFLNYDILSVNDWRRIPKEADDVDEISIEFDFPPDCNSGAVKACGVHLLYTRDIEDRYNRSLVQPNSPCGDLAQFSLEQGCMDDDIEQSAMQEAEDNGGYSENRCNVSKPVAELVPVPRRKKIKRELNMFKFTKFLRVQRKSTRKVLRSYCKVKEKMEIDLQ